MNLKKIGPTLGFLVLISGALWIGYFVGNKSIATSNTQVSINPETKLEDARQCAVQAEHFFNFQYPDPSERQYVTYESHYNKNLGQCFVLITHPVHFSNSSTNYQDYYSEDLYDAYDQRLLADFEDDLSSQAKPMRCSIQGVSCTSQTNFDSGLNPFLEYTPNIVKNFP